MVNKQSNFRKKYLKIENLNFEFQFQKNENILAWFPIQ